MTLCDGFFEKDRYLLPDPRDGLSMDSLLRDPSALDRIHLVVLNKGLMPGTQATKVPTYLERVPRSVSRSYHRVIKRRKDSFGLFHCTYKSLPAGPP